MGNVVNLAEYRKQRELQRELELEFEQMNEVARQELMAILQQIFNDSDDEIEFTTKGYELDSFRFSINISTDNPEKDE